MRLAEIDHRLDGEDHAFPDFRTFVGAAVLLQMQINQMKGFWYDRAQVAVYFCNDIDQTETCSQAAATPEQIQAVQDALAGAAVAQYVDGVEFEDREAAYAPLTDERLKSWPQAVTASDSLIVRASAASSPPRSSCWGCPCSSSPLHH